MLIKYYLVVKFIILVLLINKLASMLALNKVNVKKKFKVFTADVILGSHMLINKLIDIMYKQRNKVSLNPISLFIPVSIST